MLPWATYEATDCCACSAEEMHGALQQAASAPNIAPKLAG